MSEQYFTRDPQSESRPARCEFDYRGRTLRFTTDSGVFSRGEIDFGTRTLLNALPERMTGRALDLGCGYGAVGVSIGAVNEVRVVLSDVNTRALELATANLKANGVRGEVVESDGLARVPGTFDYILTNPPIRAGKEVIYRLFLESAGRLNPAGALYIVIRKQQGALSAVNYLNTIFPSVRAVDKSGGFWVRECKHEGEKT